jgi:elongator complex protein 3
MKELGVTCQCIRCREYGHRIRDGWKIGEPELRSQTYEVTEGREVMLSYEDRQSTLFGLLRLSLMERGGANEAIGDPVATVRELHVFGPELSLGERSIGAAQHRGLGVALLSEAERICAREYEAKELRVLSGVGAREYYRNLGYTLKDPYMVKPLAAGSC